MIHRLAPGTTIKPGAEDRKVWVCVFVSVALSRELLRPVLSALCCFRALQSQIFIPAEIGLYRRRGGVTDLIWQHIQKTDSHKPRHANTEVSRFHVPSHTEVSTHRNAHADAHTHIHTLCPGCVAVGAELSISSPALTAYPGPRR